MLQHIALVVALTFATTLACSTSVSDAQYAAMYCASDSVISGTITGGDSNSHTYNSFSRVFSKSYATISTIYKSSALSADASTVTVYRNWNEETDSCDQSNFPGSSEPYVFFGNATGTWVKLDPCVYAFPASCVPAATFTTTCSSK